jgi:hypothetical protein
MTEPLQLPPVYEANPLCGPFQGQALDVLRRANPLGKEELAVTLDTWKDLWATHRARLRQPALAITDPWLRQFSALLARWRFIDLYVSAGRWETVRIVAVPANVRRARERRKIRVSP